MQYRGKLKLNEIKELLKTAKIMSSEIEMFEGKNTVDNGLLVVQRWLSEESVSSAEIESVFLAVDRIADITENEPWEPESDHILAYTTTVALRCVRLCNMGRRADAQKLARWFLSIRI